MSEMKRNEALLKELGLAHEEIQKLMERVEVLQDRNYEEQEQWEYITTQKDEIEQELIAYKTYFGDIPTE
jgi:predicted  nucleic acid-binding Zn-ribbon protein